MKIVVTKDYTEMCKLASRIFAAQITLKPDSVLGLATGSTPVGMYKELIQMYNEGRVDFSHVKTVNLDEYAGLSGDNDQSYRYFMNHNLFDHININKENTSVPCGTAEDLQAECERYEQLVEQTGGVDIQLLGIGNDGHIGFNEPNEAFELGTHCVDLKEETIEANKRFFDGNEDLVPKQAYTMGIKTIMQARKVLVVANGLAKAKAVKAVVSGPVTPECPGSILQMHPDFILVGDEEALSEI